MFKGSEELLFIKDGFRVAVLAIRSEGEDKAFTVHIDTNFEPDGSDNSPGLRVYINEHDAYIGVPFVHKEQSEKVKLND